MSTSLNVYLHDVKIGKLSIDESRHYFFTYDEEWLSQKTAVPLSIAMPLQKEPYEDKIARAFFSNLLPESDLRRIIARKFGISENNDFALLEEIGGECAGAVSLLSDETQPPNEKSYRELTDEVFNEIVNELPKRPLLAGEEGIRLSLAGAQNKLPIYYSDNKISLPIGGAVSSHILKPPMEHFPHSVENECFCMQLAQDIGLTVPNVDILHKEKNSYLVDRYDRVINKDGELERIHQEDFCQALSVSPDQKYEKEGGPSLQQCFNLIREKSLFPTQDVLKLLDWVIFNYLIGNADAHAKNISFLHNSQGPFLSPFYDLMCTAIYDGLTDKLAMKIGGDDRPNWVIVRRWKSFANDIGINYKLVNSRLVYLKKALLDISPQTQKTLIGTHGKCQVYEDILNVIQARYEKITNALNAEGK